MFQAKKKQGSGAEPVEAGRASAAAGATGYERLTVPSKDFINSNGPEHGVQKHSTHHSIEDKMASAADRAVQLARDAISSSILRKLGPLLHVAIGVPLTIQAAVLVATAPVPTGLILNSLYRGYTRSCVARRPRRADRRCAAA